MMRRIGILLGLLLVSTALPAMAAEVSVAVAANFTKAAEEIGTAFKARTGDDVSFSFGASGVLYTQISQGAPFEVFLSADSKRPKLAVTDGFGVPGTVFTYAVGKVVLYAQALDVSDGAAVLRANAFQYVAIADPKTAPYGVAGLEALAKLGLSEVLAPKLVTGENITQALQFVDSGNAELGFVALSQVIDKPASQVWRVPAEDYSPILQDAVLLKPGEADAAAKAFLEFLKSDEAKAIIVKFGYEVGPAL